jgi:hypothetical protein
MHLGPQLSSPSPLDHPEAFPLVHQAAAHLVPFSPPKPPAHLFPTFLFFSHCRVGPSRSASSWIFFPFLCRCPRDARRGEPRRPHGRRQPWPPPCCAGAPDGGRVPLNGILTTPSRPPNPSSRPLKPPPTGLPVVAPPPHGNPPCPPQEREEELKEKEGEGEARAAAPAPSPWQPAGVRRTPQAPCPCLSRCSGRKKKGEAGGEEEKGERGAAPLRRRPVQLKVVAARPALLRRRAEEAAAA